MQGIVYGKPVNQGISAIKARENLRAKAEKEVGRKCGGLRVLNSYWVNEVISGCYRKTRIVWKVEPIDDGAIV